MFHKKSGKSALERELSPSLFEGELSGGARPYGASPSKKGQRTAVHDSDSAHRFFEDLPKEHPFHYERETSMGYLRGDHPETTIGEGVVVKGELSFQRLLRVDGSFEGTLHSEGKLIVGPKGSIKADLNLSEIIAEGHIEGNITVERLELRRNAVVLGDITAQSMSVEEGVSITGLVQVTPVDLDSTLAD